jgi:hypothetical protein
MEHLIVISVREKSEWKGVGSKKSFTINGVWQPIILRRDHTYRFQYLLGENKECEHPFYFSTDNVGAGRGRVLMEGSLCPGQDLIVTVDERFIPYVNTPLYYQCAHHELMGARIVIV